MKTSKTLSLEPNEVMLCRASPGQSRNLLFYLVLLALAFYILFQIIQSGYDEKSQAANLLFLIGTMLLIVVVAFALYLRLKSRYIIVTNKRVVYKSGMFSRYIFIDISNIHKVGSYETPINKIFSRSKGTLILKSIQGEEGILSMPSIKHVDVVKRLIYHYRKQERDLPDDNEFVTV